MKFQYLSLSQRLAVLTMVALAPALAILFYNEVALRDRRTVEVDQLARRSGQLASLEIERIIGGAEGTLIALSYAPVVMAFGSEACSTYLRDVTARLPQFAAISVLDASGILRCRSSPDGIGRDFKDRRYFRQVMETGRFVIGEYTRSRINGVALLPLAMPLRDNSGKVAGVIVGGLSLEWLGKLLREREFTKNSALTIADSQGVIIAREPFPERFVGNRIPEPFLSLVDAVAPGTRAVTSQDGTRRVIGYVPASISPTGLYVSAGISSDDAFAPIDQATRRAIAVTLLGIIAAFLISWLIGRSLVRGPIRRLTDTIEAWRAGRADVRTGMTPNGGEIAQVGVAIDGFLDDLAAEYKARREAEQHRDLLVGELDHRVKNLMSTVQAVASQTFRGDGRPADMLQAFSGRLAAMANAHKLLMSSAWSSAGIGDVVAAATSMFTGDGASPFRISGENFMLKPKAALALSMALHELCTNAVKYGALSHGSGTVTISWIIESRDGDDRLIFTWTERDGPRVETPKHSGFGSKMIQRVMASEFDADVEIEYNSHGLTCRILGRANRAVGEETHPPLDRWKVPALEPA